MRPRIMLTTLAAALALASAGCSSGIRVRTTTAPDAELAGLHTFRVLNVPQRRADAPALPQDDPMLDNSIANQALRQDLVQGFEGKGYTLDTSNPDFLVAYYAGRKEKVDATRWKGSVIVDVIDPKTKELLWRGQGVTPVSDDSSTYAKELGKTIDAILKKFPHA